MLQPKPGALHSPKEVSAFPAMRMMEMTIATVMETGRVVLLVKVKLTFISEHLLNTYYVLSKYVNPLHPSHDPGRQVQLSVPLCGEGH